MCSKKWAKPDLPGSTSLRDPVCTGICKETMLGKPVGTMMIFKPLARVFSVALKGSKSALAALLALLACGAGVAAGVCWARLEDAMADRARAKRGINAGLIFNTGSPVVERVATHRISARLCIVQDGMAAILPWRLAYKSNADNPGWSSGRRPSGQWNRRSPALIGMSLMEAWRFVIKPSGPNSQFSLPYERYQLPASSCHS